MRYHRQRNGTVGGMLRFVLFVAAAITAATLVSAHSSNPPIGHTGAPGEPTCAATGCHDQFPLNSGPGAADLPAVLTWYSSVGTCPPETTTIPMMVSHPGASRWGFELTVVDGAGEGSGALYLADPVRTQDVPGTRSYVFHTDAGTDAGTPDASPGWEVSWVLDWLNDAHPIKAHLVGVAADNDGTPQGDYVYTDSADIQIVIVDWFCTPGDMNGSGTITSADILFLASYIFKGGLTPLEGAIMGDVNCSGSVTAADVIALVNYVFKGGWYPCAPCIACCPENDGSWSCP